MSKLSMTSVYHSILYTDKYNKTTKWLREVLSGLKTANKRGMLHNNTNNTRSGFAIGLLNSRQYNLN